MASLPDFTDDELQALITAVRRVLADDRYPLAPRLMSLRAALAKLTGVTDEPPPARPALPRAPKIRKTRR